MEKFLSVVPKYSQIAMETLFDFVDLSMKEVMGRLKAVDDREEAPPTEPVAIGSKLLYTEEQWLARQKEKKKGEGSSAPKDQRRHPRKKDKAKGDPAGGGGGRGGKAGAAAGKRKATRDDTCLNCGGTGH